MPRSIRAISLFLFLAICVSLPSAASELLIRDAWVRAMPPGQRMTAGYMVLENPGTETVTVVAASTDVAKVAEFHTRVEREGMTGMREIETLQIPAGGSVALEPGGLHLMLMGVPTPLSAGDSIDLELSLDDGSRQSLRLPVQRSP